MREWASILGPHFRDPKLWVTLVVFISLFLVWFLYAILGDFSPRRRRRTRRILVFASQFREAQPKSRASLARRMIEYVQSSDQFTSCYAANIAGRLAIEFPDEANGMINALGALLANEDMLRRHAAAQALYRLGPAAKPLREKIQMTSEDYKQESAGAIASRLIQQLDDPPAWWTDSSQQ